MVNYFPCVMVIMSHEICDVFKKYITWTMVSKDFTDVIEKIATIFFIIEALALACLTKWLTRETAAQYIMCRNILWGNLSDVSFYTTSWEIYCIEFS